MQHPKHHDKPHEALGNYLRVHRRKAGISQREVEIIIGYHRRGAVSRHERLEVVPSLLIALSYQALYRVPVYELFAELTKSAESGVEERLAELETYLGQQDGRGPQAAVIARKLEWLAERRLARSA
jgi:transcriptional regulator with XRE-family HTH domain